MLEKKEYSDSNSIPQNNKEIKTNMKQIKDLTYKILYPGGNDTCLISNIVDEKERKYINDEIFKYYKNVEQVGFINKTNEKKELIMAGGEFCGNATRSSVFDILDGKTGEIEIKVSGVKNGKLLKAGVDENKNAWSEIPVIESFESVKKIDDSTYIVKLEGITHIVKKNILNPETKKEEIKKKSFELLEKFNLTNEDASGVIYFSKENNNFSIIPIVFVRSINTLFYETACGSGTAALGQVLAKEKNKSVDSIKIIQPSGESIEVSVDIEKNRFKKVKISGKLNTLQEGRYIEEMNEKYIIEKIESDKSLNNLFNKGLIDLYKNVFSKPPYKENFSDKEVIEIFQNYLKNGHIFTARNYNEVIGFSAITLLKNNKELKELFKNNLDPKTTWYMADLGVIENKRKKHIALRLAESRINLVPKGQTIIMRTSINNTASQNLYKKLGFKKIENIYQYVENKRQSNKIEKDKRIFFQLTK